MQFSISNSQFPYFLGYICELLLCFCKLVLTGSLHEGSCIYLFFNQTKQSKACCITKGTIRLLRFTCSWYKLMQDTHRGKPKSSTPRHNQITKPSSKLAKWEAWFKNSFQTLESSDILHLYPTILIKERMQVLFHLQWKEEKFKTAATMKVILLNKNKRFYYILVILLNGGCIADKDWCRAVSNRRFAQERERGRSRKSKHEGRYRNV